MKKTINAAFFWLVFFASIAYLTGPAANATGQDEYKKGLEKIVATCLNKGDNPIWIGNELHFCGAEPSGIVK